MEVENIPDLKAARMEMKQHGFMMYMLECEHNGDVYSFRDDEGDVVASWNETTKLLTIRG